MSALQAALFRDDTKQKTLIHVPVERCVISEFNPRQTRCEADIQRLAQRIERNGFELTRALWAYDGDGTYHVFAGGNRLEAVKRTTVDTVPVVLHEGFSDDEIVGLADQDNENDEYHAVVPIVDVWMEYRRLYELWGNQQRVADAKGVSQPTVKFRLKFASFPDKVLALFSTNDFLKEGHAREIDGLVHCTNLSPWLTRETAMLEVLQSVTAKHGKDVTAKHIAARVAAVNEMIAYAASVADGWGEVTFYDGDTSYPWDARAHFLSGCADRKARTLQAVKQAEHATRKRISENLREHQQYLAAKVDEAERAAAKTKPIDVQPAQWWKLGAHLLYCGDTSDPAFVERAKGAAFAFADPPYNAGVDEWDKNFIWQHDWLAAACPIVAVTPGIVSIQDFMRTTAMPYRWSVACWVDNGMTRGAVGFGNWIYVALFATGSLHRNAQDFVRASVNVQGDEGTRFQGFKGRKPVELITWLIETFTERGQTVVDPFLGSGTTLFAAERLGRTCIAGEIDAARCGMVIEEWQDVTGLKAEVA